MRTVPIFPPDAPYSRSSPAVELFQCHLISLVSYSVVAFVHSKESINPHLWAPERVWLIPPLVIIERQHASSFQLRPREHCVFQNVLRHVRPVDVDEMKLIAWNR